MLHTSHSGSLLRFSGSRLEPPDSATSRWVELQSRITVQVLASYASKSIPVPVTASITVSIYRISVTWLKLQIQSMFHYGNVLLNKMRLNKNILLMRQPLWQDSILKLLILNNTLGTERRQQPNNSGISRIHFCN